MTRRTKWAAVAASVLSGLGCANDAECDADQELVDGACVSVGAAGAGGASGAAGSGGDDTGGVPSDGGATGGGGAGGAPSGGAGGAPDGGAGGACVQPGDPCVDGQGHSDCGCDAPYCAVQPGGAEGICTVTGCAEDPSVCPDGWGCLDLSAFQAGLPSICTAPS